ncbi:hypothetical protein ACVBGC_11825 [Burkholderia stagnalis]
MTDKPRAEARRLPLPFALVRSISLDNHLSFAALRSGHGTTDAMRALRRTVHMLFHMLEVDFDDADLRRLLEAEAALDASLRAAASGQAWQLDDESVAAIEEMLSRFDDVLASVPLSRYQQAWDRAAGFAGLSMRPARPDSRNGET